MSIETANYIQRFLSSRGIPPKDFLAPGGSRIVSSARKEVVMELQRKGLTAGAMANALGISRSSVNKHIRAGKKTASHLLDGVEHNGMPEVAR